MDIRHAHSLNGTLDSDMHNHGQLHSHALIPRGVADYFWDAANYRRDTERKLLALFGNWGYGYILPPTLEYADTFEKCFDDSQKRQDIVRFIDHDGQSLALRYDMTVAIARLVGTRLHDAPMPQRFCYAGTIFRHADPQAGQQREFGQVGVELIGADSVAADTEVIALTARALEVAGLKEFRITLGQLSFFRGLLEELDLSATTQRSLIQAVARRSGPEIRQILTENDIGSKAKESVESLLLLSGTECLPVLEKANKVCLNNVMEAAVANLHDIYEGLSAYGLDRYIHIDLTEVNDLGYYTGVRFMAYAPGLGFSIASGGRYDNLIGTFGPPQPAIGAALGIERILLALQSTKTANVPILSRHVLVSNSTDALWVKTINTWRDAGIKVVIEVNGRRGSELARAAEQKGIKYALDWNGSTFKVYDVSHDAASPSDSISSVNSAAYLTSQFGYEER